MANTSAQGLRTNDAVDGVKTTLKEASTDEAEHVNPFSKKAYLSEINAYESEVRSLRETLGHLEKRQVTGLVVAGLLVVAAFATGWMGGSLDFSNSSASDDLSIDANSLEASETTIETIDPYPTPSGLLSNQWPSAYRDDVPIALVDFWSLKNTFFAYFENLSVRYDLNSEFKDCISLGIIDNLEQTAGSRIDGWAEFRQSAREQIVSCQETSGAPLSQSVFSQIVREFSYAENSFLDAVMTSYAKPL